MNTKTTGLITVAAAILTLALVATIQSLFAQTEAEYNLVNPLAPGQVAKRTDGEITANAVAPGQQVVQCNNCKDASNFAPGHLKPTPNQPPP